MKNMTAKEDELVLTEDEIQLVLNVRKRKAGERLKRDYKLHVIRLAAEYVGWVQKMACGSTYSTFCDDFGYYAVFPGEKRDQTFQYVEDIRMKGIDYEPILSETTVTAQYPLLSTQPATSVVIISLLDTGAISEGFAAEKLGTGRLDARELLDQYRTVAKNALQAGEE